MQIKNIFVSNKEKLSIDKIRHSVYFVLLFFLVSISSRAQCAMCRASLESEGNVTKAEAVNDGIVYLMVIPYVLVGVVGYLIYRMFRKKPNVS